MFGQAGKDHLPDAVLGRTQRMALRRFQVQTAGRAGDDAKGIGGLYLIPHQRRARLVGRGVVQPDVKAAHFGRAFATTAARACAGCCNRRSRWPR